MRGTWGLGLAMGIVLALQLPALGTLGMRASDLELRYPWEAGPEGTRLYQLGEVFFSPIVAGGRMVGAIAELPSGAGPSDVTALLSAMTEGLRQAPFAEHGTLEGNTWERVTPDYRAAARRENGKVFVLVQQSLPSGENLPPSPNTVEDPYYRAQNDLEILRMALESYRARHYFRYPEVRDVDALIEALQRAEVLPGGFQLQAPVTTFGAWKTGYWISVRAGGRLVTIREPERFDPFWVFWQIRPYP
ncbi:hypothetical protein D3C72_176490 [compost metagenome]